jgi:hypothetical protein
LLAGDDASDPAAGFLDIALVAGNEVDMGMGHGLADSDQDIDSHIKSVGVELPLKDGFDLIQEYKAVRLLLEGQVEVIGAMPHGEHQEIPFGHREPNKNRVSHHRN